MADGEGLERMGSPVSTDSDYGSGVTIPNKFLLRFDIGKVKTQFLKT
jgi:hypothetical protein